ncbi:efflux RND transporter periplasmic adaptor subunit [Methylocaldum sp.]|uniref:efflux RND transporter periplasmic adaptor subunit n=1 Tax=Methylocaldum sp. TaxID=1969727 RepID=UPI002D555870|nr:efflux RND transporter periplasmic adaptor subunit [Methylocaldum sp.]HYE36513.1 efflux RND transporter periplasmic adaptor subunit [Methylocaldum sp.]
MPLTARIAGIAAGLWIVVALSPCMAEDGSGPALTVPPQPEIRAQLNPRHTTTLSAELPAKILQLTVREGERFTRGQTLIGFDCAVQQAQLNKAQAVLHGAQKTYEVNSRLSKLQSISSLEVELAAAKVAEAQADIALNKAYLSKCQVTAPFDGRVVQISAHAHQYVKIGDPIMEILNDRQLELRLIVPSVWLRWLKTGERFNVQVEETGKGYVAEIVTLGARIDAVSQSIPLVAQITGQPPELVPGMSGKAIFNLHHP